MTNRVFTLKQFSFFTILTLWTLSLGHADLWWVQEGTNVPVDSSVSWGKLDNGLRYAIKYNQEPPGQVSLRLLVRSGSLHESDNQRGLAHYLEHMAFNGSKNFKSGELIDYFQRVGMLFGHHTNAHTGFDETVYKLELPTGNDKILNDGFTVLRDYADRLSFPEDKYESERGVILSEMRDSRSVDQRIRDAFFEFGAPGTRLPVRLPIGTEDVVTNAPLSTLKDYYYKWYRADRMTVVAVGDVDKAKLEALVKKHFEGMVKPSTPAEEPVVGTLAPKEVRFKVHKENEATSTSVDLFVIRGGEERIDSRQERIRDSQLGIAYEILNDRLKELGRAKDAVFTNGEGFYMNFLNKYEYAGVSATAKPGKWKDTLGVCEQELRRAVEHGFTDAEVQVAKARLLNAYEQAVERAPKRLSRNLSSSIVRSVSGNRVFTSPESNLEIAQEAFKDLDRVALHKMFSELYNESGHSIFVTGNNELTATDKLVAAAYNQSIQDVVTKPKEEVIAQFAYQKFGIPGEVDYHYHDSKLDVHQYHFKNNVRLNLKQTDFRKGVVNVAIRFGEGEVEAPESMEGITDMASSVFRNGGLEMHSITDLEKIFAGDTVAASFAVARDAFVFTGNTNKEDLRKQLNLLTAYFVAPGYREEAYVEGVEKLQELYRGLELTPGAVMRNEVDRFLADGDRRFGFPEKDKLFSISMEDVRNWMSKPLKDGYMEVTIVGDFNVDAALKEVSETLGSLPKRAKLKDISDKVKAVQFPQNVQEKDFSVKSEFNKALSLVYWPSDDIWDIRQSRQLNILTEVLSNRIRKEIREKLGQAYSPYAANSASKVFKGYGRLYALASVEPVNVSQVSSMVQSIGEDLYRNGITEDDLVRAKEPLLTLIEQQDRDNSYWLGHLGDSQENPEKLYWLRTRKDMYGSFTIPEINGVARKFLSPESALRVHVVPSAKPETIQDTPKLEKELVGANSS